MEKTSYILTVNAGSSSIKFALFESQSLTKVFHGKIDRIGMEGTYLYHTNVKTGKEERLAVQGTDAAAVFIDVIRTQMSEDVLLGVGHRVAHGGSIFIETTHIDAEVVGELEKLSPYAPRHLPAEIALIKTCLLHFKDIPQYACFDTSFYRELPRIAQLIAIPRTYAEKGIRRYGFHGLSYEYLMQELQTVHGESLGTKKIILAHLGSGSSLTAVVDGKPYETSMGFTPTSGIPMGGRSGDLDPGLFEYFMETEKMTPQEFSHMVNYESGIKGISGSTADMEVLLAHASTDAHAEEAVAFFCYHVQKQIGSLASAMGGIDILVFSGGIGEQSSDIRRRICAHLDFLGIKMNDIRNIANSTCISDTAGRVTMYMIPTNEELVIAQHVTKNIEHV